MFAVLAVKQTDQALGIVRGKGSALLLFDWAELYSTVYKMITLTVCVIFFIFA